MTTLTLVFGYRDRDHQRVERCLHSLAEQTFRDFAVIVVDYGSATRDVQRVVEQFDFCRTIYTDTRGQPWNRSHALNIGARRAESEYVLTSDVDMIFPPDFLATVMKHAAPERVIYCAPYFLPGDFDDWANIMSYAGRLPMANRAARGGCQCVATDLFHRIRGFDEFYRYWGAEDRDFAIRLKLLGIEEVWIDNETALFHQWHPIANYTTRGFIPDGFWGRAETHLLRCRDQVVRNDEHWGAVVMPEERPIWRFVDLAQRRLIERDELLVFDRFPEEQQGLSHLAACFYELPSGHAVAVKHAFYPARTRWADRVLRYSNRLLARLSPGTRIDYALNPLHAFVAELIDQHPQLIADYYLNFPVDDGVSVLVRR